jgi:hypothetical protein
MAAPCWAKVPAPLQDEVNRTVALRSATRDATWAPWLRAAREAINFVRGLDATGRPLLTRIAAKEGA